MTRRSMWLSTAALFALPAGKAVASKDDKPTRTVKGIVTDEAESPLRAVVQLKNMRTLDVKSFHANDQGQYYFHGLDPNVDYEIRAIAKGYRERTRKVSSFDDRMELFYELKLRRE